MSSNKAIQVLKLLSNCSIQQVSCARNIMFTAFGHGCCRRLRPDVGYIVSFESNTSGVLLGQLAENMGDTRKRGLLPCMSGRFGCSPQQTYEGKRRQSTAHHYMLAVKCVPVSRTCEMGMVVPRGILRDAGYESTNHLVLMRQSGFLPRCCILGNPVLVTE